ncbi:hypothetical protein I79_017728 [Cricetulus griseus]|uniref:Uncharacterized protein n=1 Tax=Cricetulus griseus TaxID=10029 RepID=G3I2T4_CRIGR|nr:hypothetical protein I79_017728 [Cricetulus griseus]
MPLGPQKISLYFGFVYDNQCHVAVFSLEQTVDAAFLELIFVLPHPKYHRDHSGLLLCLVIISSFSK